MSDDLQEDIKKNILSELKYLSISERQEIKNIISKELISSPSTDISSPSTDISSPSTDISSPSTDIIRPLTANYEYKEDTYKKN